MNFEDKIPIIIQVLISFVPALTLFMALRLSLIEQPITTYRTAHHMTVGEVLGESRRVKAIITSVFLFFQSIVVSVFAPNAFAYVFVLAIVIINIAAILCILTDYNTVNDLVAKIRKSRSKSVDQVLADEMKSFLGSDQLDESVLMKSAELPDISRTRLNWSQYAGLLVLTLVPLLIFFWIYLDFSKFGVNYIVISGFDKIGLDFVDSLLVFVLSNYGLGSSCEIVKCKDELKDFVNIIQSTPFKLVLFIYFWCISFPIIRFILSLREYNSLLKIENTEDLGLEIDVVQKIGYISSFLLALLASLLLVDAPIEEVGIFTGLLAAALSLALKDTLGNLMAGALLIWDGSLKKGDVVTIPQTDTNDTGSTYGIIQEMRMRYTIIEDRNTVRRLIPNSVLVSEPIESWTHEDNKVRLSLNIGVSYKTDLPKAKQIMESVCYDVPRIITKKPPQALVVNFGDHSVDFSLRFWLRDTNAGIRPVVSEVLIGIKKRFDEEGIEIPFPQRDLWLKNAHLISPYHNEKTK